MIAFQGDPPASYTDLAVLEALPFPMYFQCYLGGKCMISDPSHAVMLQYPTITSIKVRKEIMKVILLDGSEIPNNHLACVKP